MQNNWLYIIVTDYPFDIGEPFLEQELEVISPLFNHIYIIIPEVHNVNRSITRYKVPSNCEIIELETRANLFDYINAGKKLVGKTGWEEIKHIKGPYQLKPKTIHLRNAIGFLAAGIAFARNLKQVIHRNGHSYDSITLYSYWCTFATAGLALLKEKHPNLNTLTRVHGWDCFFHRNTMNYLPLRPWLIRTLDKLCPISNQGKEHLMLKIPSVDSEKIIVSYLGVITDKSPEVIRYQQGTLRLVSIAFIQPVKRIKLLIEALSKVKGVKLEWEHIGSWSREDQVIIDYANEVLKGNPDISFIFHGEQTSEQVHQFFQTRKADFLICTSSSEGLPVSMMEAMAYGMPVISTSVGGIPEIIKNGYNGYLIPEDSSAIEITKRLIEISNIDVETYSIMSRNAISVYNESFNAEVNFKKFASDQLLRP